MSGISFDRELRGNLEQLDRLREQTAARLKAADARMRVYPTCCTSAFCGEVECSGCSNLPVLREFRDWVRRTGATVADPIWSPLVYRVPV